MTFLLLKIKYFYQAIPYRTIRFFLSSLFLRPRSHGSSPLLRSAGKNLTTTSVERLDRLLLTGA
jgi:hypothetical protein